MNCRFCATPLRHLFADLGLQPSANRFLGESHVKAGEGIYPLRAFVCESCRLVQLADDHGAEQVFDGDYVYFSSFSAPFVEHARRYVAAMAERYALSASSFVVEIASNDGYLLQHVVAKGVPCLGVDPAADAARAAAAKGVETRIAYFGRATAAEIRADRGHADLIAGNNVFAHVPDLNDFVGGIAILLAPGGVLTLEFPHLLQLVTHGQFDTIYDEHFSYFSFGTARTILRAHGLEIFDVEELAIHGGSLRIHARHAANGALPEQPAVAAMAARERAAGMEDIGYYQGFQPRVEAIRDAFLRFLVEEKAKGSRVAAFGAAAKGNTFLNFCGVTANDILFVADDTPSKQGKFLPGTHIPVVPADRIATDRPDVILILPWNFKAAIVDKLAFAREWGCRFVTCIPAIQVD